MSSSLTADVDFLLSVDQLGARGMVNGFTPLQKSKSLGYLMIYADSLRSRIPCVCHIQYAALKTRLFPNCCCEGMRPSSCFISQSLFLSETAMRNADYCKRALF